jgi:hypothetical protein
MRKSGARLQNTAPIRSKVAKNCANQEQDYKKCANQEQDYKKLRQSGARLQHVYQSGVKLQNCANPEQGFKTAPIRNNLTKLRQSGICKGDGLFRPSIFVGTQ